MNVFHAFYYFLLKNLQLISFSYYICTHQNKNAKVAQLVERQPSKLNVASSTLVFRSKASNFLGLFYFKSLKSDPVSISIGSLPC